MSFVNRIHSQLKLLIEDKMLVDKPGSKFVKENKSNTGCYTKGYTKLKLTKKDETL